METEQEKLVRLMRRTLFTRYDFIAQLYKDGHNKTILGLKDAGHTGDEIRKIMEPVFMEYGWTNAELDAAGFFGEEQ